MCVCGCVGRTRARKSVWVLSVGPTGAHLDSLRVPAWVVPTRLPPSTSGRHPRPDPTSLDTPLGLPSTISSPCSDVGPGVEGWRSGCPTRTVSPSVDGPPPFSEKDITRREGWTGNKLSLSLGPLLRRRVGWSRGGDRRRGRRRTQVPETVRPGPRGTGTRPDTFTP